MTTEFSKAIEKIIPPRVRNLGDHEVRRVLPFRERRMVGPFIFLDQFGPLELIDGRSLEVAPHPHIGLATVTYLFSGTMMHRDSVGSVQLIRPGENVSPNTSRLPSVPEGRLNFSKRDLWQTPTPRSITI
jgi:redox-sensitive bicupin YhaK (pirin superfamily)